MPTPCPKAPGCRFTAGHEGHCRDEDGRQLVEGVSHTTGRAVAASHNLIAEKPAGE